MGSETLEQEAARILARNISLEDILDGAMDDPDEPPLTLPVFTKRFVSYWLREYWGQWRSESVTPRVVDVVSALALKRLNKQALRAAFTEALQPKLRKALAEWVDVWESENG